MVGKYIDSLFSQQKFWKSLWQLFFFWILDVGLRFSVFFWKNVWLYHATPGTIKNKCWLTPLEQSNIAKHKNWALEDAKLFHRPMAMLSLGGSSHELDTWLISMAIISPLRIGLWDPFQVAELWGDPNYLRYLGWSSKYRKLLRFQTTSIRGTSVETTGVASVFSQAMPKTTMTWTCLQRSDETKKGKGSCLVSRQKGHLSGCLHPRSLAARPWKLMVGIGSFPFGARPIFRGYVSLRAGKMIFLQSVIPNITSRFGFFVGVGSNQGNSS